MRQIMEGHRFDPSLLLGAGARCRFGGVRVLICSPLSPGLKPFPTTFWLLCPFLSRRAGAVEAEGGVRRLGEWLSEQGLLGQWRAYNWLHQKLRLELMDPGLRSFLRRFHSGLFKGLRLGGVGGVRGGHVKCLHLQTASWLALGYHPGEEWLSGAGLDEDCGVGACLQR